MRLHEPCKFCYWTKMGVQLPTASSRQILEAEAGEKGRRFLFKCCTIWENGRLLSQIPSPPGNPEENSATLSQTKIKGNVQSSFSHSKYHQVLPKYHFGNHRWLLSGHPGRPQALSLEPVYGAGSAIGHVASRTRSSRKHTGQYIHEMASTSLPFLGFILVFHVDSFPGPNFQVLWEGPASNQSLLFSKLDWQYFNTVPTPATVLTSIAQVPAFPWSHTQSGTGRG